MIITKLYQMTDWFGYMVNGEKRNESFKEFIEDYWAKEQMQWEAEHCKDYL